MEKYSLPSGTVVTLPERSHKIGLHSVKILDAGKDVADLNKGDIVLIDEPLTEACEIDKKYIVSELDVVAVLRNIITNTPIVHG